MFQTETTWTWTNRSLQWSWVDTEPLHHVSGTSGTGFLIAGGVMRICQSRATNTSTLGPGTTELDGGMWALPEGRLGLNLQFLLWPLFFAIWRLLWLDAEVLCPCSEDRNPTNSSVSWHIVFKHVLNKFSFLASSPMFSLSLVIFSIYLRPKSLLSSSSFFFWQFLFFTAYSAKETITIYML